MSSLLTNIGTTGSSKVRYTFDEVLTIVVLKKRGLNSKAIASLIGHTEYSVTYKYSIWTKKMVKEFGQDNAIAEICKKFKSEPLSDSEIEERVEKFLATKVQVA